MVDTGAARGLVLVVEDERSIAELLSLYLTKAGFGVHVATSGPDALAAVRRHRPVAVVLDLGLPGLDGVDVCRRLRESGDWTPIIVVSARDDEVDRILALELGADDYVTKPFSPREVVTRVRTVLRRSSPGGAPDDARLRRVGAVEIDTAQRRCRVDGKEVHLTATEFDLLAHLLQRPGRVFEREELLSAVWGYSAAAGTRTVDVHIAQLRSKLGAASPIRTVRGVGYAAET